MLLSGAESPPPLSSTTSTATTTALPPLPDQRQREADTVRLLTLAAEAGIADAQTRLARMLGRCHGVAFHMLLDAEAARWFAGKGGKKRRTNQNKKCVNAKIIILS
jgi:hypothetical protein